jgi:hypothetical protein
MPYAPSGSNRNRRRRRRRRRMTISLMLLTYSVFMNIASTFDGRYIDSTLHAKRYANRMNVKQKSDVALMSECRRDEEWILISVHYIQHFNIRR